VIADNGSINEVNARDDPEQVWKERDNSVDPGVDESRAVVRKKVS
jgi:hypothetical protein